MLNGDCGIVSTKPLGQEFASIPSQVAGIVPKGPGSDGGWTASDHVSTAELRQTAKFTQYGLAAAEEALADAGFENGKGLEPEMTVGG